MYLIEVKETLLLFARIIIVCRQKTKAQLAAPTVLFSYSIEYVYSNNFLVTAIKQTHYINLLNIVVILMENKKHFKKSMQLQIQFRL